MVHRILFSISLLIAQSVGSCGSNNSGSTPATSNVLPIVVNAGPAQNYFNGAFTSVTLCAPNQTTACQTIDGVLVDTGSTGLRILSAVFTVALAPRTSNGPPFPPDRGFPPGYTCGDA